MPAFDLQRVHEALVGTIFYGKLHHFTSIDSTQNRANEDARSGAEAGQVYLADEQTAGRGRGGHRWLSEPEDGLYLTALVRPALRAEKALHLSLAAGLAAQAAIEQVCSLRVDLRWPNDLVTLRAGLKLGGILSEGSLDPAGTLRHAAIGIGINLNQHAMPDAINSLATSLRIETGQRTRREDLAAALLIALDRELYEVIGEPSQTLQRFAQASSWVHGKPVRVAEGDGYTGVTAGLTEAGLLLVRCQDGSERVVRHGGVREA